MPVKDGGDDEQVVQKRCQMFEGITSPRRSSAPSLLLDVQRESAEGRGPDDHLLDSSHNINFTRGKSCKADLRQHGNKHQRNGHICEETAALRNSPKPPTGKNLKGNSSTDMAKKKISRPALPPPRKPPRTFAHEKLKTGDKDTNEQKGLGKPNNSMCGVQYAKPHKKVKKLDKIEEGRTLCQPKVEIGARKPEILSRKPVLLTSSVNEHKAKPIPSPRLKNRNKPIIPTKPEVVTFKDQSCVIGPVETCVESEKPARCDLPLIEKTPPPRPPPPKLKQIAAQQHGQSWKSIDGEKVEIGFASGRSDVSNINSQLCVSYASSVVQAEPRKLVAPYAMHILPGTGVDETEIKQSHKHGKTWGSEKAKSNLSCATASPKLPKRTTASSVDNRKLYNRSKSAVDVIPQPKRSEFGNYDLSQEGRCRRPLMRSYSVEHIYAQVESDVADPPRSETPEQDLEGYCLPAEYPAAMSTKNNEQYVMRRSKITR